MEEAGFSLYRGIIVRWDEDYDTRILDFIDDLEECDARALLAVQEHEGSIAFRWKHSVPPEFAEGQVVVVRDGDGWSVFESVVVWFET